MRERSARIGLRLAPRERERIAGAAVVDGRTLSEFVREAAVRRATAVLDRGDEDERPAMAFADDQ